MIDVAYVAGIVDARGHIELYPHRVRLRVTTKRIELIEWLAAHSGTTPRVDNRGYERRPCSEHCTQKHSHMVRQSSYWNVDGARALIILHACLPYLVSSSQRTRTIQAIRTQGPMYRARSEITQAMHRLGWPIPTRKELVEGLTPAHAL